MIEDAFAPWTPQRRFLRAQAYAAEGRIPSPSRASFEERALTELVWEIERAAVRGVPLAPRLTGSLAAKALALYRHRSLAVEVEALLLARCSIPLVWSLLGIPVEVVHAYAYYFFDIDLNLNHPQVIVDQAILCERSRPDSITPRRHTAMKLIAYFCGPAPLVELYSLDKRHSNLFWSLPSAHLKRQQLTARIDAIVDMIYGDASAQTINSFDAISDQIRETLGEDFPAYPTSAGRVDFIPRAEAEAMAFRLTGCERAR